MSAGGSVLEFTLGLKANEFLSELGISARELLSFTTIAEVARVGLEKMWTSVERGAQLEGLAHRTRESAGALYELEQGFKAAGLSADDVGGVMTRIQRALTGVTMEGENAQAIFGAMHLTMAQLKAMDAPHQVEAIATALSRLDVNSSAGLAQRLFAREGAGGIQQIAGALKEFREGVEGSARNASVWDRSADAFHKMEVASMRIKEDLATAWAEVAEKAAPAFEKVLGYAERVVTGFTAAFASGDVTDLIATAITSGFKAALDALPAIAEKMGYVIFTGIRDSAFMVGSKMGEFNATHAGQHTGPDGRPVFNTNQKMLKEVLDARAAHFAEMGLVDSVINAGIDQDLHDKLGAAKGDLKPLIEKIDKIIAGAPTFSGGPAGGGRGNGGLDLGNMVSFVPKFTDMEKMGLVMPGLGNPFQNEAKHQRNQMIQGLHQIRDALRKAQPFAQAVHWAAMNLPDPISLF